MTDVVVSDPRGHRFRLAPIACPICKTRDFRSLGMRGGRYQRHGLGIPLEIVQCRQCALLWPDPFPYPLDPSGLYGDPSKYFVHEDEAAKLKACRDVVIRPALRHLGKPRPSLLDVGSGRAELLRAAVAEGLDDVTGLELAQATIEDARERLGIRLIGKTIEEFAVDATRTFDLVTFSAVLEHVHDPDAAIAAARRLTHSGSMLYLDVPHEPNLLTTLVGIANRVRRSRGVINLAPTFEPFHVFGFNERALKKLLGKHGFEIVSIWIYSEMDLPIVKSLRGGALKLGVRAFAHVANRTGTAANMYVWARRT
ncbi:MAG: class I SAM-dependent methyltransferase [Labilithrix sp.]|nr:class I SAM-dependent methyltransferase [Labilithrix sp.]